MHLNSQNYIKPKLFMVKSLFHPLLLIISFLIFSEIRAQQLSLSKNVKNDSTTMDENMRKLAIQVIANYKEVSKENYLDNLFRYYIVAKDYRQSLNYLDSLRFLYAAGNIESVKGIGFIWELYARSKILQAQKPQEFKSAFSKTFNEVYSSMPTLSKSEALSSFGNDYLTSRNDFYKAWNTYKEKDSISMDGAKSLIRIFNRYLVTQEITDLGKILAQEVLNKEYIIQDSLIIKMKDGANLSGILVRKREISKPIPAILIFNIYAGDKDKAAAIEAANHGYAGIVMNTRGKFLSPQNIEPFEHDASDGYEIIDWISKQSWNNGKVGMLGGSYLGFSQWAAVKHIHPALKTIVPQVSAAPGIDFPTRNHIFMSYMLRWLHYVSNNKKTDIGEFNNIKYWRDTYKKWYATNQSFRNLDSIEGRPNSLFQRWLSHPEYDGFWKKMIPYQTDFSKINIPILTTTGYYDADQLGAMYYFNEHHKYNSKANHYLIIGPYNHYAAQSSATSEFDGYKIDSVANININEIAYQWFDYILRGGDKPKILEGKVNYQVMGANEWRHSATLSKMNNDTLTLYFSNSRKGRNYSMAKMKPRDNEFIRQQVDLSNRDDINEIEEAGNSSLIINSGFDNLVSQNDITFISDPFENSFSINGCILGNLFATINKKDMDIRMSVFEQMPDGKYFALTNDYIGRSSYSSYHSKRKLLQPGVKEKIAINNNFFTSKLISKGSRLLIVLGVNKDLGWQINYGSGKDVSDETISDGKIPLKIKWHTDSYLKVPVWRDNK